MLLLLLPLVLSACFLKGDTCPTIDDVEPAEGGSIATDGTVTVTLTEEDGSASLDSVTPGNVEVRGRDVIWTPAASLTPGDTLSLTLTTCDGEEEERLRFTVEQGDPIGGASPLTGKGWKIELAGLLAALGQDELKLTATGGSRDELDLAFVGSPCLPLPTADFSDDPYFEIGPDDAAIPIDNYDVGITDFRLSGSFADGGDRMVGVRMSYTMDLRLVSMAVPEFSAADLCDFVKTFDYTCVACRDTERFCVEMSDENLSGEPLRGGPFCN